MLDRCVAADAALYVGTVKRYTAKRGNGALAVLIGCVSWHCNYSMNLIALSCT